MLKMPTGIYIRVSTEEQAREGFSINAQKDKLTKYAEVHDWDIYDFYIDDGISGKNIVDRPEITRLINDVKTKKIENVLVYKLDRLTRSLLNLMELINLFEKYDCSVNSHTEKLDTSNAVGRMFVKILGTFAEFERENLAERVSFGYEQKTKEGNYTNTNGVYGYDYIVGEGILKVNEIERVVVNRIYDEYIKGTSMLGICKIMNDENVQTKRGGKWSQSTIRSILTNPLYIGRVRYGVNKKIRHRAFETDGVDVEPIVDEEKFELVGETMKKRGQFKSKKYPSENTYYYRVMKCGACDGSMHARQQKKNGVTYITYACNNRLNGTCTEPGFSHSKIEDAFVGLLKKIKNFMPDESIILSEVKKDENKKLASNIEKEIEKLYNKKDEVRDQFIKGSIEFDEYRLVLEKLEEKRNLLNEELGKYKEEDKKDKYTIEDIKKEMTNVKKNWIKLTNLERRTFLEQFVKYIVVEKVNKKIVIKDIEFNN